MQRCPLHRAEQQAGRRVSKGKATSHCQGCLNSSMVINRCCSRFTAQCSMVCEIQGKTCPYSIHVFWIKAWLIKCLHVIHCHDSLEPAANHGLDPFNAGHNSRIGAPDALRQGGQRTHDSLAVSLSSHQSMASKLQTPCQPTPHL